MEGFKVSVAGNGEKGLADIKKKKPDIVLLDLIMPGMDGVLSNTTAIATRRSWLWLVVISDLLRNRLIYNQGVL